jgi:CRISPR-associated exonuclease Cas4
MITYPEEDLLPLSGIQHFAYCERQWGLIHIENQWEENVLTAQGRLMHKRTEDPLLKETRGSLATTRAVPVVSYTLGLYGVADVIEIEKSSEKGLGLSIVEYKRGKHKPDDRDEVQLCAQAICMEEMLGVSLSEGYLYYGETRHRQRVAFDEVLRARVRTLAHRMHELHNRGETPRALKSGKCRNCSLVGVCLPGLGNANSKVNSYVNHLLDELKEESEVIP